MKGLIERLEKADGPSFALECEIARAVGRPDMPPNNYTYSVDAALTLVPKGWECVSVYTCGDLSGEWKGWAALLSSAPGAADDFQGCARTAPLALCIAALKARSEA